MIFNPPAPVDALIARLFHAVRLGRHATDPGRYA
jgi:hypothetical protein